MILPGATLGMLGGGQLGRMFTQAAQTMGYRVVVLDPDSDSPAGQIADQHLQDSYSDPGAMAEMAQSCQAVSTEFENVPAASLAALSQACVVRPSARSVEMTQDRIREKCFLRDASLPTGRFHVIESAADIPAAMSDMAGAAILKRATFGYDGKGQAVCDSTLAATQAFEALGSVPCVLEEQIALQVELSVVLARAADGTTRSYPVAENIHVDGILDRTLVPARVPPSVVAEADQMARRAAQALDYCGVMAVEFFLDRAGALRINEIAPRPHNSGHYTIDACWTSQFEQQVRMMCGLPAGSTRQHSPAVMVNLLGDLWRDDPPDWGEVLAKPSVKLHLYGKSEARPGRKMGHFTCLSEQLETALAMAKETQSWLNEQSGTLSRVADA